MADQTNTLVINLGGDELNDEDKRMLCNNVDFALEQQRSEGMLSTNLSHDANGDQKAIDWIDVDFFTPAPPKSNTLTDDSKFKVFQKTSGHFLTECVPDNWNDLDDTESDDFLTSHLTSDLEHHTASDVYSLIEDAATVTIELIESNTLTFTEEK